MHILTATGIFHPEAGGPATYLYNLLPDLQARGHSVQVLTFGDADDGPYPYPVTRIPRRSFTRRQLDYWRAALRLWPGNDVAFVHSLNIPLPRRIGPIVGKIVGDPAWERAVNRGWLPPGTGVDAFQTTGYSLPVELNKAQRARAAQRYDHIIVPGEYLKRMVVGWGVDLQRVTVVYNALRDLPSPPAEDRAEARRALGLPLDCPLLLTAARLTPWKGVEETLRALAAVPDVQLVVAGDGPQRAHLEHLAAELGLAARVSFRGQVARASMPLLYRAADYALLYSGYEGLSHVLLESLALGTPVIASDSGGNPEVVRDGVNGLLVPYPSVDALHAALARAIAPGARDRLAAQAHDGLERFAWERMVEQTAHILEINWRQVMYTLGVKRDFVAQHYLIGGDWGPENDLHSHHYAVELRLEGAALDAHGYLVDIVDVEAKLDALVAHYRDHTLNDLPEFAGLNPSIEHFSRILCERLSAQIDAPNIGAVTVAVWENEIAWTSYRVTR